MRHHVPDQITPTRQETRTFGISTDDLHALQAWLTAEGVTHVLMESTGSYWKPLYNLLETTVIVWLVNPAHVKTLRGRKTMGLGLPGHLDRLSLRTERWTIISPAIPKDPNGTTIQAWDLTAQGIPITALQDTLTGKTVMMWGTHVVGTLSAHHTVAGLSVKGNALWVVIAAPYQNGRTQQAQVLAMRPQ